jgi:hypothetical protein
VWAGDEIKQERAEQYLESLHDLTATVNDGDPSSIAISGVCAGLASASLHSLDAERENELRDWKAALSRRAGGKKTQDAAKQTHEQILKAVAKYMQGHRAHSATFAARRVAKQHKGKHGWSEGNVLRVVNGKKAILKEMAQGSALSLD